MAVVVGLPLGRGRLRGGGCQRVPGRACLAASPAEVLPVGGGHLCCNRAATGAGSAAVSQCEEAALSLGYFSMRIRGARRAAGGFRVAALPSMGRGCLQQCRPVWSLDNGWHPGSSLPMGRGCLQLGCLAWPPGRVAVLPGTPTPLGMRGCVARLPSRLQWLRSQDPPCPWNARACAAAAEKEAVWEWHCFQEWL